METNKHSKIFFSIFVILTMLLSNVTVALADAPVQGCQDGQTCVDGTCTPGGQACEMPDNGGIIDEQLDTETPLVSVALVDPATDTSVVQNTPFDFTVEVACNGGYCGDVTVALDPPTIRFLVYNPNTPECRGGYGQLPYTYLEDNGVEVTVWCNSDVVDASVLANYDVLYLGRSRSSGYVDSSDLRTWVSNGGGVILESNGDNFEPGTSDYIWNNIYDMFGYNSNLIDMDMGDCANSQLITKYADHPIWEGVTGDVGTSSSGLYECDIDDDDVGTGVKIGTNQAYSQNPLVNEFGTGRTYSAGSADYTANEDSQRYFLNIVEWLADGGKGIIPMDAGEPFYTTTLNPMVAGTEGAEECLSDMDDGDTCSVTWSVMPTGTEERTYQFFVQYDYSGEGEPADVEYPYRSDSVDISLLIPDVTVTLVTPAVDSDVIQNQAFDFTVEVACHDGYCGDVDLALDPIGVKDETLPMSYLEGIEDADGCNGGCVALEVNGVVKQFDSELRHDYSTYQSARDNCLAMGADMVNFDESYVWVNWYAESSLDLPYYGYEDAAFCEAHPAEYNFENDDEYPTACCGMVTSHGFGWHDLYDCSCHYCPETADTSFHPWGSDYGYVCVFREKGIIPMDEGTPFYTTTQNPMYAGEETALECLQNMDAGDSCTVSWNVMPTGAHNSAHTFFIEYNVNMDLATEEPEWEYQSDSVVLTIIDTDFDDDGIVNDNDNCLNIPNQGQADADDNDVGDACEFSSAYAKTSILTDGEMSSWEWNDAAVKSFWFVSDEEHPDDYIYLYTKSDDQNLYVFYDVVPDDSEESCSYSGCDWAKLNIYANGEVHSCTVWGDGNTQDCDSITAEPGFMTTPNKVEWEHRTWEFKVAYTDMGMKEGDSIMMSVGGYGTLSLPTGEPWTFPEAICSGGESCPELDDPETYGASLELQEISASPSVAWTFQVGTDGYGTASSIMDATLFDFGNQGYSDVTFLTQASDEENWCAESCSAECSYVENFCESIPAEDAAQCESYAINGECEYVPAVEQACNYPMDAPCSDYTDEESCGGTGSCEWIIPGFEIAEPEAYCAPKWNCNDYADSAESCDAYHGEDGYQGDIFLDICDFTQGQDYSCTEGQLDIGSENGFCSQYSSWGYGYDMCGENDLYVSNYDSCEWTGSQPSGFCSACNQEDYSAYAVNGNDGLGFWVNHDFHGDRIAVGNVYDGQVLCDADTTLVASESNDLVEWNDAEADLCRRATFVLPSGIEATQGSAGEGSAYLTFRDEDDQLITCEYVYQAQEETVVEEYDWNQFVSCEGQQMPEDMLMPGDPFTTDYFRLSVNGDPAFPLNEGTLEMVSTDVDYGYYPGAEVIVADNQGCDEGVESSCFGVAVLDKNTGEQIAFADTYDDPVSDIEVADFDNDGLVEIAVGTVDHIHLFKLYEGEGGLSYTDLYDSVPADGAHDVEIADINGDGTPDVVTIDNENDYCADSVNGCTLRVISGKMSDYDVAGYYQVLAEYDVTGQAVDVGDIDGDGTLEIVAGVYAEEPESGVCSYNDACSQLSQEECGGEILEINSCHWESYDIGEDGLTGQCVSNWDCSAYSDEESCTSWHGVDFVADPDPAICTWTPDVIIDGYGIAAFDYVHQDISENYDLQTQWFTSTHGRVVDIEVGTFGNGKVVGITAYNDEEEPTTVYDLDGNGNIVLLKPYIGYDPEDREIDLLRIGDIDGDGVNDLVLGSYQSYEELELDESSPRNNHVVYAFNADGTPLWRFDVDNEGDDLECRRNSVTPYDLELQSVGNLMNVIASIGRKMFSLAYAPTCDDGMQNGDETNVDCGGACTAENGQYWYNRQCNADPEPVAVAPVEEEIGGSSGGCITEWICSEWSSCNDGQQTRTCEKELSYCYVRTEAVTTQACQSAPSGQTGSDGSAVNACGDGNCNAALGENTENCAVDCPAPPSTADTAPGEAGAPAEDGSLGDVTGQAISDIPQGLFGMPMWLLILVILGLIGGAGFLGWKFWPKK